MSSGRRRILVLHVNADHKKYYCRLAVLCCHCDWMYNRGGFGGLRDPLNSAYVVLEIICMYLYMHQLL